MKKVLFVATVVKIHIMVFHLPYLEWFKKNGYEVHVAARNDYENKSECHIPYCDQFYDLPFERSPLTKNNYTVYEKLKKIIDENDYEIIHCHTPIGGAIGRLAARHAQKKGSKVFYTAHGFHFYKGSPFINWLVYYPIEKWLAKYTDILFTINREDYELAKKFKAKRVEYIPGVGIDTNKFKNIEVNAVEKRRSIGVNKDDYMLISVGELNKNKNHQIAIKAISKLKNRNIKYVLCGEGPLENDLRTLAEELGVEDQIKFIGFRTDIPELMTSADVFVFPSYREGLSLSLMEAMATGLPIICSKIRGNVDLVYHQEGGFLIQPSDDEEVIEKIKILIQDKNLRSEMSDFNLNNINKFNLRNVLREYERIVKNLE